MPVKSEKQRKFFEGIAHGMKPKKKGNLHKIGPSPEVAKEFLGKSKKAK